MTSESVMSRSLPSHPSTLLLLSIVTITRDDPAGLARTLTSCASWRKTSGVEQIVVDGNKSSMVSISEETPEVRVVRRSARGIADAFNTGLAVAQGKWVWYLNSGDAVHEDLDPVLLCGLLNVTRAQVLTGALQNDGEEQLRLIPPLWSQWPLLVCWLAHPATLVRRDCLREAGGFDLRWKSSMDYDLWFRLLSKETTVDTISVPIARFDLTGVSQRRDSRVLVSGENAAILWRHKMVIFRSLFRTLRGLASVIMRLIKNYWF